MRRTVIAIWAMLIGFGAVQDACAQAVAFRRLATPGPGAGAPGPGLGPGVGAPGVGARPSAGVGAPGAGVRPGVGAPGAGLTVRGPAGVGRR